MMFNNRMSSNRTQNVTNRLDELTLKTPRNQPINTSQPGAPIKEKPLSQNQSMLQTNAKRKLNVKQGGSSNITNANASRVVKKFPSLGSKNAAFEALKSLNKNQLSAILNSEELNQSPKRGATPKILQPLRNAVSTIIKKMEENKKLREEQAKKNELARKEKIKSMKKEQKPHNIKTARTLVSRQKKIINGSKTEITEDDVYFHTMYKFAKKMKVYRLEKINKLIINNKNYKSFMICYDQDSKNLVKSAILISNLPYVTNVANLFDPGEGLRKIINFDFYIKSQYIEYRKNNNLYSDHPIHIVDYSPMNIKFKLNDKTVDYYLQFIPDNLPRTKLTTGQIGYNYNNYVPKEYFKKHIRKIIDKDDEGFVDYLLNNNFVKIKKFDIIKFTLNLDDEKVLRAIQNDMIHDFSDKPVFSKLLFDGLFKNTIKNEFNKNTRYFFNSPDPYSRNTSKSTLSQNLFLPNQNGQYNTSNTPIITKTLGDLSQIIYCIKNNVIYATGDKSAINMAINVSRNTNNIKRLKLLIEEPSNYHQQLLIYLNYPTNFKTNLKYEINKTKKVKTIEEINTFKELQRQAKALGYNLKQPSNIRIPSENNTETYRETSLSKFKGVNKMASATPTFKNNKGKGSLLVDLRKEIQKRLASNPTNKSLRKFVNEEIANAKNKGIILSPNNENNIRKRLIYEYDSLRRNNLN